MIELKNVSKVFSDGTQEIVAVDDVSLHIDEGEIFGIIGYSGAGKSTLVRTLNGLEQPTSGSITVAGKELSRLSGKQLRQSRQKIGMIFQHFNILWSRTVVENIMFPLEIAGVPKKERLERAQELVRLVGLDGREGAYPSELSGGQKQRVGIARALANDPDVLLCDEATSALDPKTTDDVLELLLDINRRLDLTIVIITHEMEVIRKICDRVAVMQGGRVVETGKTTDIFQNPKEKITREFIQQDEDEDIDQLLSDFREYFPEGRILRVTYPGNQSRAPIISRVSREFNVDINIIRGSIYTTQNSPVGTLYVQVFGDESDVDRAIDELQALNTEVLS
ncbi:methionine ABC transporter ATP-binding protein [Dolosigranulum pigrum]|mgnify:FL=1|jgi:methionine import ATP-binding protein metN 2|uniref:Methionine ABC transporter ATP-binding protein n=1 Tax=Dolosigranulum pigrum TaxID=29394 RepID=A0A1S8KQ82_9LACT|nr:methionine ABC transporter ATP-binding protein [Dolosigranulum pigrum]OOL81894.1 methionine ABC transporter ATP-binding protein [Dolosigranulum pigrum]QTJ32371.1 methionine ABC transporter ATP-binding protein [Dolosigranulum pigrum]QTJ34120.1 methionine ABC transporter ATP-binding protein [Dolosigranulum pigrum]QTJ39294.1 methionine ABC transporter ATP-binding protein [Dolosigranulum pigrum]QTJ42716.1 methionine ABC transporter ATP-binding protein [Dolosigranulum pigrum]